MTIYEKLIFESLLYKPKNIMELEQHIGIDIQIIINCINNLIAKDFIKEKQSLYYTNIEITDFKKNLPSDLQGVLETTAKSCIEKQSGLFFNRLWLSPQDQRIFEALLYQVRSFLENVKKDQKHISKEKIKDQKVFFYCNSSVSDLLGQSLAEL